MVGDDHGAQVGTLLDANLHVRMLLLQVLQLLRVALREQRRVERQVDVVPVAPKGRDIVAGLGAHAPAREHLPRVELAVILVRDELLELLQIEDKLDLEHRRQVAVQLLAKVIGHRALDERRDSGLRDRLRFIDGDAAILGRRDSGLRDLLLLLG